MASSLLCFTLLLLTLCTADGYVGYSLHRCLFNSTELKDIQYIYSCYFNKVEFLRFDSNVGKYVGFNEFGMKNAEHWNNDPYILSRRRAQKETFCHHNSGVWYRNVLLRSVKPSVRLHSMTPPGGHHPAMLVCGVYNFYPKQIKVSWLRHGQEVTSDVTSTDEMADGNWLYQIHSHLEHTPRSGEKISCIVEHASLKEPLITDWDPSMPESERNKLTIGASGPILGLILSLGGFIYYRRKARGLIPVPSS